MKLLAHLATNRLVITRLTTVSGYRRAFSTVTTEQFNIQPLDPDKTRLYEGQVGKTYVFYCEGEIDIEEGDKLRDISTGQFYKVVNGGVSRRAFGAIDVNEVIVEETT